MLSLTDVIFKNQASSKKEQGDYVNDLTRSSFHKEFMHVSIDSISRRTVYDREQSTDLVDLLPCAPTEIHQVNGIIATLSSTTLRPLLAASTYIIVILSPILASRQRHTAIV